MANSRLHAFTKDGNANPCPCGCGCPVRPGNTYAGRMCWTKLAGPERLKQWGSQGGQAKRAHADRLMRVHDYDEMMRRRPSRS